MNQTDQTYVALYCRTASSSYMGIQSQADSLKRYANQQGYTDTQLFIDDGFSGLNYDRPGFQQIVRGIEAGNVKIVVACNLVRFVRDYYEMMHILGVLHDRYGVHFETVDGDEFPQDRVPDWIQAVIGSSHSKKGGAAK